MLRPAVTINNVPTLETRRLLLREIRESDAPDYFALCSDLQVMKAYGIRAHQEPQTTLATIRQLQSWLAEGTAVRWGLFDRTFGRLIGDAGFWRFDRARARGEIGAKILPEFSGQGLMSEAIRTIIAYSFETMQLHSIEAGIAPANQPSIRLFEKLGFKKEGHRRSFSFNPYENCFCDSLLYSLLDSDWRNQK